jgi:hypothetical protein
MVESVTNTNKKLFAFGCSCTVGEYLPGWQAATLENNWQTKLSDDAWPFVLARKLCMSQVENKAWGGDSNHEIMHKILLTDFQPGDIAVIGWSYAGREITFHPKGIITQTMWGLNAERFYAAHDIEDLELKSMEYVHHIQLYLKSLGVKYVMAAVETWNFKTPQWRFYNPDDFVFYNFIDRALDNEHPGLRSHAELAYQIYQRLGVISN